MMCLNLNYSTTTGFCSYGSEKKLKFDLGSMATSKMLMSNPLILRKMWG